VQALLRFGAAAHPAVLTIDKPVRNWQEAQCTASSVRGLLPLPWWLLQDLPDAECQGSGLLPNLSLEFNAVQLRMAQRREHRADSLPPALSLYREGGAVPLYDWFSNCSDFTCQSNTGLSPPNLTRPWCLQLV
jgi:hypothetical protein